MNEVIDLVRKKGKSVFYNPQPQYAYKILSLKCLDKNTYRGFHKIKKELSGSKEAFESILNENANFIKSSLLNAKTESDIDTLEKELCRMLYDRLMVNIKHEQLHSFNKIRKPVDIIIEHLIAMGKDFFQVREKLIKYLFLPLDSQMFGSPEVFNDYELKQLRIRRNFTFKDIYNESHYFEIQSFLKEKANSLEIDRIFFDLFWNKRYKSRGLNLFATNPKNPLGNLR